jgi:hypothetical protein
VTINQAIVELLRLRNLVGDVQVCADCPYCSRSFEVQVVVTGPPVVSLRTVPEKP